MRKTARTTLALLLVLLLSGMPSLTAFAEEPSAVPAEQTAAGTAEQTGTAPAEPTQSAGEGNGIIDAAVLDEWADTFVKEKNLDPGYQDFSIGFCYTGTGDSWYYNADVWMYSASMYKVPVSMLLAEKVAAGELTQQSVIRGITVEYAESTALVYSNNDSGHAIVDYLGGTYAGKCSDQTEKYTDLPTDYFSQDFIDVSYYTARYMTQVMKTLYDGGEEAFPHVIEYLLQAQPGAYYRKSAELEGKYQIAQKFGAYEERTGSNNNHCAAIIYTPTPIVVVVMTRNVMDYQNLIAQVGEHLAAYALELDRKAEVLEQAEAERLAAEAIAAERGAEDSTVEMPMPETENAEIVAAGSPDSTAGQTGTGAAAVSAGAAGSAAQSKLPTALFVIAGILAAAIVVLTVLYVIAKKRAGEEEAVPDDGLDWAAEDEPEEEEPPADRRNANSGTKKKTKIQSRNNAPDSEYRPRH